MFPLPVLKHTYIRTYTRPLSLTLSLLYYKRYFSGTDIYIPSEYYQLGSYQPESGSVWAIGCLAYILVTGRPPFNNRYSDITEHSSMLNFVVANNNYLVMSEGNGMKSRKIEMLVMQNISLSIKISKILYSRQNIFFNVLFNVYRNSINHWI